MSGGDFMQSLERRKLERFDLSIPAKIRFAVTGRKQEEIGLTTINICSGGAFFKTTQPLPVGTKVDVDLTLPLDTLKNIKDIKKKLSINVSGKVLHIEPTGMGVGFDAKYQLFS